MFSAASFAPASLKSAITTFAPSLANSVDMDNPIPEAPPVTNANYFTLYPSYNNPPALQNMNIFAFINHEKQYKNTTYIKLLQIIILIVQFQKMQVNKCRKPNENLFKTEKS